MRCVYLPKYNKLVPATEKLPSGTAWLEALERFRKALWLHEKLLEKQSPSNDNEDEDDTVDNTESTQPADDAVAAEDAPEEAVDVNVNAVDVNVNDLDTLNALSIPKAYVPKYLLAFILLGPFSLEPNPAWNITSLAVGKSKKVLPSAGPVERPTSTPTVPSSTPEAVVLSPANFVTPDGTNVKPLSRADFKAMKQEITGKKKREREASSALEVAALERSNTIMEQKNVLFAERNKARAKKDAIELKEKGIRMAVDLDMDPAVILKLKTELFEMIQNTK